MRATRRLAHVSGDGRQPRPSRVHDVSVLPAASLVRVAMTDGPCRPKWHDSSVLPAASLVRAAMTDGPCRPKCTMYPC